MSFVILADVSSSMTGKLPFVREATLSLLDALEEEHQYSDEYSVGHRDAGETTCALRE